MQSWTRSTCLVLALAVAAGTAWAGPDIGGLQATAQLRAAYPDVQLLSDSTGLARVYGSAFSFGDSPEQSAAAFVESYSVIFGVASSDLVTGNTFNDRLAQPVMYDADSNTYRFTLVYYHQQSNGIPVFRSNLRLLVRNEPGYPLVLASSSLNNLGDFVAQEVRGMADAEAQLSALAAHPALVEFGPTDLVVWPDAESKPRNPRVAIKFVGDDGRQGAAEHEKYLFVADATTGEILYEENLVLNTVTGTVNGFITPDYRADACETEHWAGLPYARVSIGTTVAYADARGDYSIDATGTSITSEVRGRYFNVNNQASGGDATITLDCNPPQEVDFFHNQSNTEIRTAEVNAYYQANRARDNALAANPLYPVIGTQYDWAVNVNIADTCNAYYNGSSINFYRSGDGCNNTAFGDVVHHEYGHHLVASGGSGQGAYGEGMADTCAFLITGRSQLGIGFENCLEGIRDANNNMQYPCSGEIHECGQLLSGCFWDLWELLPLDHSHVRDLAINSIMMHSGDDINPSITIDVLALDDGQYTDEIIAAFSAHNMLPPDNDLCENAIQACPGIVYTGVTGGIVDGSASCGDSNSSPDVWYSYTPAYDGTLTASLCSGTNYDSVLSIHTGCPGNTDNEVGCDDDGCGGTGGPSTTTVSVQAGHTYLIRVSGWNGDFGQFSLQLTGPECGDIPLLFGFPEGLPEVLAPGVATTVTVQIDNMDEEYVPGSGQVMCRFDGGEYVAAALTPLGDNLYSAALPAANCAAVPEFYFSAQGSGGSTVTSPVDAPAEVYTARVGTLTTTMEDDFETQQGWTVQNSAGLADGQWGRGVPVNCDRGDPPEDFDGSGQCYLTDNSSADACNSDVDDGYTWLISPTLDMSGGDGSVHYALWYTNYYGNAPHADVFKVWVSNNNGANWTQVASFGPTTSAGWTEHIFWVGDYVTPTAQVKVRFEASDLGDGSVVEAGVDDFSVMRLSCEDVFLTADMNCDGLINFDDIDPFVLALSSQAGYEAEYPDCNYSSADCNRDGSVNFDDIDAFVELLAS
jgi:hypothetical protein